MGIRVILFVFFTSPAWAQFTISLLGYNPAIGRYVSVGVDGRTILLDTSTASPFLKCALPSGSPGPVGPMGPPGPRGLTGLPGLPAASMGAITSRAVFALQADGTWTAAASFNIPLPNFDGLIQVFWNGLLQETPVHYLISYSGGILTVTPKSVWAATDMVRAVWVQ